MNLHTDALNKEPLRFNMYEVLKTLFSMYLSTNNNNTETYKLLLHSSHKREKKCSIVNKVLSHMEEKENSYAQVIILHTGGPRGSVSDEAAGYQIVSPSLISSPCANFLTQEVEGMQC